MKIVLGEFREYLKVITAILGAGACILIGMYLYATASDPKSAVGILEMFIVFSIGAMFIGGLAFLTEEEVGE